MVIEWLQSFTQTVTEEYLGSLRQKIPLAQAPSQPPTARVLAGSVERPLATPPQLLPWSQLTTLELLRVFSSERWQLRLDVNKLARVLQLLPLGISSRVDSLQLAQKLFPCFDRDANGWLDSQEFFIGLSLLCCGSTGERLGAAFHIMDLSACGEIYREELEKFVVFIAPGQTPVSEIRNLVSWLMRDNEEPGRDGIITCAEVGMRLLHD